MTSGGGGGIIIDITCAGRWERPAKIQTNGRNRYDEKEDFSPEAREDLEAMMDMVIDMLNHAVKAFDTHDLDDIVYVDDKEADLDYFNKKAKQRHIKRVGRKIENSALVNSTYVDILANLERMGDHCQNISESYLLDESAYLNEEPESAFSK